MDITYFDKNFSAYACVGDSITTQIGGLTAVATLYHDDSPSLPWVDDDGFWPSRNPAHAGYMGEHATEAEYLQQDRFCNHVKTSYELDQWCYVGVAVRIFFGEMPLTEEFTNALWSVDCNYPGSNNTHLRSHANDLLEDALNEAKATIKRLASLNID